MHSITVTHLVKPNKNITESEYWTLGSSNVNKFYVVNSMSNSANQARSEICSLNHDPNINGSHPAVNDPRLYVCLNRSTEEILFISLASIRDRF